jgi:ribosome-binding protein aMBF1 (putative translation factor)
MIKNEKQYKISKKKLKELALQMDKVGSDKDQAPLRNQLLLASLADTRQVLEEEVAVYDSLKKNKKPTLKERLISELPSIITEYKIISGLTQKEFSEKLGLKEQQLQRYEADNFKSVTFKNLLRFFDIMGLEIRIKETKLKKAAPHHKTPGKRTQLPA